MSPEDQKLLSQLNSFISTGKRTPDGNEQPSLVNLTVRVVDLDLEQQTKPVQSLIDKVDVQSLDSSRRSWVILQSGPISGRSVIAWSGWFNELSIDSALQSPVRQQLAKRLLAGDAVVWLLACGKDQDQNQRLQQQLRQQLDKLSTTLQLPEGIGQPGSELYSEVPLLMEFSIVKLDYQDSEEKHLIDLLRSFDAKAIDEGQPLVVPIFGRGRALEVIPADRVQPGLIGDLTAFLCGACSCQVKQQNPGFDLLMQVDWHHQLFGQSTNVPTEPVTVETSEPKILRIPPGRKR
jgi:hypothetical protein